MMNRPWPYVIGGLVLLFVILQLVPSPGAENPPVEEEVAAPPEVVQLLRRSCYDCHSHETAWPWYASVAPAKWLVRDHVEDARAELNFSTWNRYDAEELADKLEEVAEEVGEEHMPLRSYLILHGDARLTDAERRQLVDWAAGESQAMADRDRGDAGDGVVEDPDRAPGTAEEAPDAAGEPEG